jgi:hypothetical protein
MNNVHQQMTADQIVWENEFIIEHYPYARRYNHGDVIEDAIFAMRVDVATVTSGPSSITTWNGTYGHDTMKTYDDPSGEEIFDYGTPWTPPQKIMSSAEKQAMDIRTFHWLCEQATNGSASAQCDLGEHYLKGIGTETNQTAAIEWLQKAAAQGDDESSNVLAEISATNSPDSK